MIRNRLRRLPLRDESCLVFEVQTYLLIPSRRVDEFVLNIESPKRNSVQARLEAGQRIVQNSLHVPSDGLVDEGHVASTPNVSLLNIDRAFAKRHQIAKPVRSTGRETDLKRQRMPFRSKSLPNDLTRHWVH